MMPIYGIELCDEKIVHISGVGNYILNGLRLEISNEEKRWYCMLQNQRH